MRWLVVVLGLASVAPTAAAECTDTKPCVLPVIEGARKRVGQEREMVARMANAPASENNINNADRYTALLREWTEGERTFFSDWCALEEKLKTNLERLGSTLSSKEVFRVTGKPDEESFIQVNGAKGKLWAWYANGPLSGSIAFGILFARPIGSSGAWVFEGCNWCVAGGEIWPRGCMTLPWKP